MGWFNRGIPNIIKREIVVGLTPLGKQKVEAFAGEGPKFEILATLDEKGPSTLEEIGHEVHMSPGKLRVVVKHLIRAGYVKKMGDRTE